MLSLRLRTASLKLRLSGPASSVNFSRAVHQFSKSGLNPRTTLLLTNLQPDINHAKLTEAVKGVKEIIGVDLQPGCSLHYHSKEVASKAVEELVNLKHTARIEQVSLPALQCTTSVHNETLQTLLQSLNPVNISTSGSVEEKLVFRAPYRLAGAVPEVDLAWLSVTDARLADDVVLQSARLEPKPCVTLRNLGHLNKGQVKDILRVFAPQYVSYSTSYTSSYTSSEQASGAEGSVSAATAVFATPAQALQCVAALHRATVNGQQLKASVGDFQEHVVQISSLPLSNNNNNDNSSNLAVTVADLTAVLGKLVVLKAEIDASLRLATLVFRSASDAELAELLLKRLPVLKQHNAANNTDNATGNSVVSRFVAGDLVATFGVKEGRDRRTLQQLQEAFVKEFGTDRLTQLQTQLHYTATFRTLAEVTAAKDAVLAQQQTVSLTVAPVVTVSPSYAVEVSQLCRDTCVSQLLESVSQPSRHSVFATHRNATVKVARHEHLVGVATQLRGLQLGRVSQYRMLSQQGDSEYDTSAALQAQTAVDNLLLKHFADDARHSVVTRYRLLRNEFERSLASALHLASADPLLLASVTIKTAKNSDKKDSSSDKDNSNSEKEKDTKNKKKNNNNNNSNHSQQTALVLQVSAELAEEARKLVAEIASQKNQKTSEKTPENTSGKLAQRTETVKNRLFEIYLQRADKEALSEDVQTQLLLMGEPTDAGDALFQRWESKEQKTENDIHNLTNAENSKKAASGLKLAQFGAAKKQQPVDDKQPLVSAENGSSASSSSSDSSSSDSDSDSSSSESAEEDDDAVKTMGEEDTSAEEQKVSQFSAMQVRDEHGYVWHGTVLDTDMVQKTMPGKRIASHRALVVVGNMRGTAGFGSGKGKTPALAVEGAFRAALKNLSHIDLYENTGLAHDCLGQHNSCRAYVRATPPSRLAVASPFSEAVLNAFGIGSASVKLVGRRNPYSMVNALFDALSKHENIDEYAKRRGKRYLTLKWLKDQKV